MNGYERAALLSILASVALAGCAAPLEPEAPDPGLLQVYSATYAPTIEQSEYPVHTDYTIATRDDQVVERVSNLSGPFNAFPARVRLSPGRYRVKAQYDGGKFVVFPVDIEPDRITTVDLNNEATQPGADPTREPISLPGGRVVGWYTQRPQFSRYAPTP